MGPIAIQRAERCLKCNGEFSDITHTYQPFVFYQPDGDKSEVTHRVIGWCDTCKEWTLVYAERQRLNVNYKEIS